MNFQDVGPLPPIVSVAGGKIKEGGENERSLLNDSSTRFRTAAPATTSLTWLRSPLAICVLNPLSDALGINGLTGELRSERRDVVAAKSFGLKLSHAGRDASSLRIAVKLR